MAQKLIEKGLSTYKRFFVEHSTQIAWILQSLGVVVGNLGNYTQAKELIEKSLITHERLFGKESFHTACTLRDLGRVYLLEGQLEKAEPLLQKALRLSQAKKHPESYVCLEILADLYFKKAATTLKETEMGQFRIFNIQAFNYLRQALKIVETHFPKDSLHIARIQSKLKEISIYPS